jgi:hypothetical protein
MVDTRMAYEKFGMGSGPIGDRLYHTILFSNPPRMAIETRCKKRRIK